MCCWIAEMPLSDSQVRALKAGERRQSKSVGDSLILVIESVARGGGKSFEGRMRFPSGRAGKQVPVRIGPYRIRAWSKQSRKRASNNTQILCFSSITFIELSHTVSSARSNPMVLMSFSSTSVHIPCTAIQDRLSPSSIHL